MLFEMSVFLLFLLHLFCFRSVDTLKKYDVIAFVEAGRVPSSLCRCRRTVRHVVGMLGDTTVLRPLLLDCSLLYLTCRERRRCLLRGSSEL
jgi:hypothetical protein